MFKTGKRKSGFDYPKSKQFKSPVKAAPRQSVKAMVAAAVRQVAETKVFDSVITNQTPTTSAQIDDITNIDAGVGEQQRVGTKVELKSVGYKFTGTLLAADTTGNQLRVILFLDRQSNATALPAATTLLQTDAFDSFYNMDNIEERFVILDDRIIDMPAMAGVSGTLVPQPVSSNVYKKVSCKTTFADSDADIPNSNAIRCLQIGRNGGGNYRIQFRARFTDL